MKFIRFCEFKKTFISKFKNSEFPALFNKMFSCDNYLLFTVYMSWSVLQVNLGEYIIDFVFYERCILNPDGRRLRNKIWLKMSTDN
jgi:hypothetical protein